MIVVEDVAPQVASSLQSIDMVNKSILEVETIMRRFLDTSVSLLGNSTKFSSSLRGSVHSVPSRSMFLPVTDTAEPPRDVPQNEQDQSAEATEFGSVAQLQGYSLNSDDLLYSVSLVVDRFSNEGPTAIAKLKEDFQSMKSLVEATYMGSASHDPEVRVDSSHLDSQTTTTHSDASERGNRLRLEIRPSTFSLRSLTESTDDWNGFVASLREAIEQQVQSSSGSSSGPSSHRYLFSVSGYPTARDGVNSALQNGSNDSLAQEISSPHNRDQFVPHRPRANVNDAPRSRLVDIPVPQSLTDTVAPGTQRHNSETAVTTKPSFVWTRSASKTVDTSGFKNINQYVILDTLGQGSTAKVKLAFDTIANRNVAIKVVRHGSKSGKFTNDEQSERDGALRHEIAILKKLRHDNIVSVYELIDDPEDAKMFLVMQYVDKGAMAKVSQDGTIENPIRPFSVMLDVARQVASGLCYLHRNHIIHHDIKPENILQDAHGRVFLSDFGVSEFYCRFCKPSEEGDNSESHTPTTGRSGTPLFMAPELLLQKSEGGDDLPRPATISFVEKAAVDIWAFGITLFVLYRGTLPFMCTTLINNSERKNMEVYLRRLGEKIIDDVSSGKIEHLLRNDAQLKEPSPSDNKPQTTMENAVSGVSPRHKSSTAVKMWEDLVLSMLSINAALRPTSSRVVVALKEIQKRCIEDEDPTFLHPDGPLSVTPAEIATALSSTVSRAFEAAASPARGSVAEDKPFQSGQPGKKSEDGAYSQSQVSVGFRLKS